MFVFVAAESGAKIPLPHQASLQLQALGHGLYGGSGSFLGKEASSIDEPGLVPAWPMFGF
jgi:hypothetical protein